MAGSDPDIVWLGTGRPATFERPSPASASINPSTPAGPQSAHGTGRHSVHRPDLIHPENPDVVYVAAASREWTPNPEQGVYKTADGRKTWEKVLFLKDTVGAIDLVMDPKNPDVLIASMVNRIRRRWSDPVPGRRTATVSRPSTAARPGRS